MTRIILFTGKGGVGKTTVAAATGIRCASIGYKTLVISTDPAHSLADSFQRELAPYPVEIRRNLYGMEVNVEYELEKHWEIIKEYLKLFFLSQGIEDVVAEELAIFPGFDELASLLHLLEKYESGEYDVIILDCAPTGETLRLLSVPEVAKWYMNRFFGIEKKLLKVVRPIAEPLIDVPLPSEEVLDKVQELYVKIGRLKEILEGDEATIRLVLNPEKMVIKESERAFTYLNLFGYAVDAVIINKIFPEEAGGYFKYWFEAQKKYMEEIKHSFPVPIFKVMFKEREIMGDELDKLASEIYGERDPAEVFVTEKPMKIVRDDDGYAFCIKAPFIRKEEVKLMKRGDELIVVAGQWKRIVFLPQSLALKDAVKASFNNGEIKILFR